MIDQQDLHDFFQRYTKSLPYYFHIQKIKDADWSDRYRLSGNITVEEIALFLLITGSYTDEQKIAHLTLPFQKLIKKQIIKYLNIYEKERDTNRILNLINSTEFKKFKKQFRKNGDRIDYYNHTCIFNEYVNYHGSKNHKIIIETSELQDLKFLAFTLYSLEKQGITPQTYHQKVKKYIEFIKKGSKEFGIRISQDIPFSNPTKLYIIMDTKLTKLGLSTKQKKVFYSEFDIREKIPNSKLVEESLKNMIINELGNKFRLLPSLDQDMAIYLNKNIDHSIHKLLLSDQEYRVLIKQAKKHIFSNQYYAVLKEYNLIEFPIEAIDPYYNLNTQPNTTDNPWKIIGDTGYSKQYLYIKNKEVPYPQPTIEKLDQEVYASMEAASLKLRYPDYKELQEKSWKETDADIARLADDSHQINN